MAQLSTQPVRPFTEDDLAKRHVLDRLTIGATGERLAEVAAMSPAQLVEMLLAEQPSAPPDAPLTGDDDWGVPTQWWFDILRDPASGLHERMVWFWHGHLTSSIETSSPAMVVRQNQLLRQHALGNFRELMQAITIDPAMLLWLNGAGSTADNPNENYARELMELFAFGRNQGYTETDVHNAARALAGWWVDDEDVITVDFDRSSGPQRSLPLFGRLVKSAEDVVNAVCDHPACAPYIAGRVYWAFHGVDPADDVRAQLAAVFSNGGLEIRPLVEATIRHPSFAEQRGNRPRSHLEWFIALSRLYGLDEVDAWPLQMLGQAPFHPPNVAGWPGHDRWISVGAELTKAQVATDLAWEVDPPVDGDVMAEYLWRAAIDPSEGTVAALAAATAGPPDDQEQFRTLLALITLSPEFNVS